MGKINVILNKIFPKGSERSSLLKKNIVLNAFIKVFSILISFLLVPLSIKFVGEEDYGVWLTLSSVIVWMVFFDIGFSNGLRNKYAEAKALDDKKLLREYVSTTFFSLSAIFAVVWVLIIFANSFIDWTFFFGESLSNKPQNFSTLFLLIITYFCLLSIFKLLGTILYADQRPFIVALIDAVGQLICLLFIWILMQVESGTLFLLGLVLCAAPLFVWICANIYFFNSKKYYKDVVPSLSYFKFSRIKNLMGLGGKFFIIQVAGLIQYQTANFIIAYYYTTTDVTYYNLVYKYFSAVTMLFSLFLAPLWSAVTDAYTKRDYDWIKWSVNRFLQMAIGLSVVCLVMLFLGNVFFNIWVGEEITNNISMLLMIWCCAYTIVMLYSAIYVNILNGMGILNTQFILSLISPVLYLIVVYILIGKFNLGIHVLFIALLLTNLNGYVAPIQYYRLTKKGGHFKNQK